MIKKFIEKQKAKSLKSKIIDYLSILLLILLLIPATRKGIKTQVIKFTIAKPDIPTTFDTIGVQSIGTNWGLINEKRQEDYLFNYSHHLVLINFWATWCAPCRAEMESFNELYKEFKGQPISFLFVSDENINTLIEFKRKHGYEFPVYQNRTVVPQRLQTSTIPATFVIDDGGLVLFSKKGAAKWDSPEFKSFLYEQIRKMHL